MIGEEGLIRFMYDRLDLSFLAIQHIRNIPGPGSRRSPVVARRSVLFCDLSGDHMILVGG